MFRFGRFRLPVAVLVLVVGFLMVPRSPSTADASTGSCLPQCHSAYTNFVAWSEGAEPGLLASDTNHVRDALAATVTDMTVTTWTGSRRYFWIPVEDYKRTLIVFRNDSDVAITVTFEGESTQELAGHMTPVSTTPLTTATLAPGQSVVLASSGAKTGNMLVIPALDAGWSHVKMTVDLIAFPTSGHLTIQNTRSYWGG